MAGAKIEKMPDAPEACRACGGRPMKELCLVEGPEEQHYAASWCANCGTLVERTMSIPLAPYREEWRSPSTSGKESECNVAGDAEKN